MSSQGSKCKNNDGYKINKDYKNLIFFLSAIWLHCFLPFLSYALQKFDESKNLSYRLPTVVKTMVVEDNNTKTIADLLNEVFRIFLV